MADSKPVAVMDPADTHLTIVGVGGTGGFVAANAARLLWGLKQQRLAAHAEPGFAGPLPQAFGELPPEGVPDALLVDGDLVERKNVVRQEYRPHDVGRPKALVLAERMSPYALTVSAYPRYLNAATPLRRLVPEGAIVVGCVDNAATRRILHEKLMGYRDVVYLDAGNGAVRPLGDDATRSDWRTQRESGWSGQVVCGVRRRGETLVPFPGEVMPDLIEGDGPEDMVPDEVPCHAVVESQPQRFLTNLRAATVITEYLGPLLTDGHLLHARTFFDARRLYAKSYPAIDELDQVAA
jgi:hypothetical protein